MKINILPEAREDIVDAYWFYEDQAEELGSYFITSILDDIDRLSYLGGTHAVHQAKIPSDGRVSFSLFYLL